MRNTIGNVPVRWYDNYDHIGYDWTGNKVAKPQERGEIDEFLARMEDPDYWRQVHFGCYNLRVAIHFFYR